MKRRTKERTTTHPFFFRVQFFYSTFSWPLCETHTFGRSFHPSEARHNEGTARAVSLFFASDDVYDRCDNAVDPAEIVDAIRSFMKVRYSMALLLRDGGAFYDRAPPKQEHRAREVKQTSSQNVLPLLLACSTRASCLGRGPSGWCRAGGWRRRGWRRTASPRDSASGSPSSK